MDGGNPDMLAIHALGVAYCEAVARCDADVFAEMCHDRFQMSAVTGSGGMVFWDKPGFIERVTGRAPFPASYEILSVDVAGGETARLHLWIDVPPRRYEDHLGFVRTGGRWQLLTKVFRTLAGPALEG